MTTTYRAFYNADYQLTHLYPLEAPIIPSIHLKNDVVHWHDFTEGDITAAQKKAEAIGAYHRQRLLQKNLRELGQLPQADQQVGLSVPEQDPLR